MSKIIIDDDRIVVREILSDLAGTPINASSDNDKPNKKKQIMIGDITHGYRFVDEDLALVMDMASEKISKAIDPTIESENKVSYREYKNNCSTRTDRKSCVDMRIVKVIFNEPATIILWGDGTKTVVKCIEGETFDPEKGIAMAFMKHAYGDKGRYFNSIKRWTKEYQASKSEGDDQ